MPQATADPALIVSAARAWLGTPYHDQASLRGVGCDCLGLARGVWRAVVGPEPFPIPPYSRDWAECGARDVLADGAGKVMIPVPLSVTAPGHLLIFRMRSAAVAKHLGIMTMQDRFVHAYEATGVIEERLSPPWARRLAYAFAFPAAGTADQDSGMPSDQATFGPVRK